MGIQQLLGPLVGEIAGLEETFLSVGEACGDDRETVKQIFGLLPAEVKIATAFFDNLGSRWRYDYGEPLEIADGAQVILGPHQWPEVLNLYRAVRAMEASVAPLELHRFVARLSNRSKHQDVLFEARPLFFLQSKPALEFEAVGRGRGNRTIDWRFVPSGLPEVLLEVKYRVFDIIQYMEPIARGSDLGQSVPEGPGDPAPLFRDTAEKFVPADPRDRLQGAWVHSYIKVTRSELIGYFDSVPEAQLHFAILSNWEARAFLLSRASVDRTQLVNLFGLEETDDAVID